MPRATFRGKPEEEDELLTDDQIRDKIKGEVDEAEVEATRLKEEFEHDLLIYKANQGKPFETLTEVEKQAGIRVFLRRKGLIVAEKKLPDQALKELRRRHKEEYDEILAELRENLLRSDAPPQSKKKSPGKEE